MDGENNGKTLFKMDDLGGTTIFGNTQIDTFKRIPPGSLTVRPWKNDGKGRLYTCGQGFFGLWVKRNSPHRIRKKTLHRKWRNSQKSPGGRLTQKRKLHPSNSPTRWDSFQGLYGVQTPGNSRIPMKISRSPPKKISLKMEENDNPGNLHFTNVAAAALQIFKAIPRAAKSETIYDRLLNHQCSGGSC